MKEVNGVDGSVSVEVRGELRIIEGEAKKMLVTKLSTHPQNPRKGNLEALGKSIDRFGFYGRVLVQKSTGYVLAGNHRYKAIVAKGAKFIPVEVVDVDDETALGIVLADNRISDMAEYDDAMLAGLLTELGEFEGGFEGTGYDEEDYASLLAGLGAVDPSGLVGSLPGVEGVVEGEKEGENKRTSGVLVERFVVPPFTVLDTRQGYWLNRKRAWLGLGIRSEKGRDGVFAVKNTFSAEGGYQNRGNLIEASVFDPVLCEIAYRWFSAPGSKVLDPFAGGSVRGIVAAMTGRLYTGIELRQEQVAENMEQWPGVLGVYREKVAVELKELGKFEDRAGKVVTDPLELTPVEWVGEDQEEGLGGIYLKRDDLFEVNGVAGGKVRTCYALAVRAKEGGAAGLVTAGSRQSPQVNIVANVAAYLGLECRVHTPGGELSEEVEAAVEAGAVITQHKAGYNSVIIARAREDAEARGFCEIPFGMECEEASSQTRRQVANIPEGASRIVMPVGSGMSLAGVLWGLKDRGLDLPVLGVCVGADPTGRLDRYAPDDWSERVELIESSVDYHDPGAVDVVGRVKIDPIYESKCVPYLEAGDVFWLVGIRQTAVPGYGLELREGEGEKSGSSVVLGEVTEPKWITGDSRDVIDLLEGEEGTYDLVFTCPPYADLEVYSDDPRDLSTLEYEKFVEEYRKIIERSCRMLKDDSFAVIVVGDVRDESGAYRNFVGDTVDAFRDAGLSYYNEAIYLTSTGTLPFRAGRYFKASRKLGKHHQNFLVFVKGDGFRATKRMGEVEPGDLFDETATLD